jgi:hypothetical protein
MKPGSDAGLFIFYAFREKYGGFEKPRHALQGRRSSVGHAWVRVETRFAIFQSQ